MSCGCGGQTKVSTRGAKGDPGSCIPIVNILYADLVTLQTNSQLVPATIYFITDKNVYLQALTINGLDSTGIVKATNADYNNVTTNFIGVWTGTTQLYYNNLVGSFSVGEIVTGGSSGATGEIILKVAVNNLGNRIQQVISKNGTAFTVGETITGGTSGATCTVLSVTTTTILGTIAINKIVSWNNLHYVNITGSGTIKHPKYDTTNWTALATTDISYQVEYDKITYNFATATIIGREDKRGNIVVDQSGSSVTKFQWGRFLTFDNKIFSFSFENWNANTANNNLLVQDGGFYIGDTAVASFSQSTGRSTVVMIGPASALASKSFHGTTLTMTNGNGDHVEVDNFGDVSVYDSGVAIKDSKWNNVSSIITGTSQILGCRLDGGSNTSITTKNFSNENHTNRIFQRDVLSTFPASLSQAFGLTTLTLDTSLFYGTYNVTITGGVAAIDTIGNMPSIMPVQINSVTTNTLGIVNNGAGSILLKGRINKSLFPSNKDWIIFQNISGAIQEVNSSLINPLPVLNTLFVSKSGNDTTGTAGRFDLPFLTITAAQTAASSGQTIVVYPGTYIDTLLGKDGVNYHFINGAIITSGAASVWTSSGTISYSITGDGEFQSTSGGSFGFSGSGTFSIASKRISNTTGQLINLQGTVKVYANIQKEVISTSGICIVLLDSSTIYLTTNYISSTAGTYVVSSQSDTTTLYLDANLIQNGGTSLFFMAGTASIYGDMIYTNTGNAIQFPSNAATHNYYGTLSSSTCAKIISGSVATTGTINFYGKIISTGGISISGPTATFNFYNEITTNITTAPSISMTTGTVKILNTRITNLDVNAASYGITKTVGTLILQNSVIVTSGGTECVHSSAPQNYKILGTLASNVVPSVNLTDLCGGLLQIDTDIQ